MSQLGYAINTNELTPPDQFSIPYAAKLIALPSNTIIDTGLPGNNHYSGSYSVISNKLVFVTIVVHLSVIGVDTSVVVTMPFPIATPINGTLYTYPTQFTLQGYLDTSNKAIIGLPSFTTSVPGFSSNIFFKLYNPDGSLLTTLDYFHLSGWYVRQ